MVQIEYIGNCTQDDVIEELFGDVSRFACLIEEHGDEFIFNSISITYDSELDIHSFHQL
jgi:hypothetical protein